MDDYGIPTAKLEIVEWINGKPKGDDDELLEIFQVDLELP